MLGFPSIYIPSFSLSLSLSHTHTHTHTHSTVRIAELVKVKSGSPPNTPPKTYKRLQSEDNQYISMSRSHTLNPELLKQLAEGTHEREGTFSEADDNDPTGGYLTMRSYPIHLQRQEVAADGEGELNPEVFSVGSHRELAPSYMTVRQRIRSAPAEESHSLLNAPNTAQNLPEPLIPAVVSTSGTDRLNIPPPLLPSGYSLATAALSDKNIVKSSAEEALIPSSIRFIYPTSTTASATTSSSVTGVSSSRPGVAHAAAAPPVPSRPADRGKDQSHITAPPMPVQRTKLKSESDTSASTLQANGSSVSARPPAIPPRTAAAGGSPQSQQRAKKRPMPPPRRAVSGNNDPGPNDSTAAQLSPKKAHGPQHASTGFSDSEIRIQTLILSDPEFQSCTPEVCMQALKKHKYEVDAAREEIRVHMLMEMQMAHITTEDCRRALSHCQQKTDRAAAWLLEQSDDIERRRQ